MITKTDIEKAHERVKPFVHRTPIFTSNQLNQESEAQLYFKSENLQKIGAFKARGAFNFGLQLSDEKIKKGLCTHSSGNHAQAVALVAQKLKVPAYIVMPENAPQVKIDAVKGYGAQVTFCYPSLEARESTLKQIQEEEGCYFMPPYNHELIITGAATAAKELLEEIPSLDLIVAPIGGGGLLAGSALSAHFFGDNCKVFGAEPKGADDAKRSLDAGNLIPSLNPNTIADGLLTSVGEINFEIIQNHVSDILVVEEEEIRQSMRTIWERMKLVVEPSSAVALAAVLKSPNIFSGKNVGIVLSGGNVDLSRSYF